MFPIRLSIEIAPTAWGEASRNVLKILKVLNGEIARAGIYVTLPAGPDGPRPDRLVAIVSRRGFLELRVDHPDDKPRCHGYLVAVGPFSEGPLWRAHRPDTVVVDGRRGDTVVVGDAVVGRHRNPAIACGLITGITAAV